MLINSHVINSRVNMSLRDKQYCIVLYIILMNKLQNFKISSDSCLNSIYIMEKNVL